MEDCVLAAERAALQARAVGARREDRADHRQRDLPAVRVAGEHQIEVGLDGLADLIRRMRQEYAKEFAAMFGGFRRKLQIGRRTQPRLFVAGDEDRRVARHHNAPRAAADIDDARGLQCTVDLALTAFFGIVIAEDEKRVARLGQFGKDSR